VSRSFLEVAQTFLWYNSTIAALTRSSHGQKMDIKVNVCGRYHIATLAARYPAFSYFHNRSLQIKDQFIWTLNKREIHDLTIFFYGKTGYGKSSTINRLVGNQIMGTHDLQPCTKKINSVQYEITDTGNIKHLSFNDLPGIGESADADIEYIDWYSMVLPKTACCVYVLRADQRDFSLDLPVFEKLFQKESHVNRVLLGINFADKIEPITRSPDNSLTQEQNDNLLKKSKIVQEIFKMPASNIVCFSAEVGYNFTELTQKIANILKIYCII
jgi:predicted GTPase